MKTARYIRWTRGIWLLLVCLASFAALAEDARQPNKFSTQAPTDIGEIGFAIDGELAQLKDHPWAGKYYHGNGTSVNITLALAPTNGFVFYWHGCLGVYGQNFGTVEVSSGLLKLGYVLTNAAKPFRDLSVPYLPVVWGERKYLIATNEMIEFCNAINGKWEPRKGLGDFLLRQGDEKKGVTGWPEIPVEYHKYLLKEPIEVVIAGVGKLKSIGNDDFVKVGTLVLNKGSEKGLFQGMEFHFVDQDYLGLIKVKTLTEKSAEAEIQFYSKDKEIPEVGMKLSTLPTWCEH